MCTSVFIKVMYSRPYLRRLGFGRASPRCPRVAFNLRGGQRRCDRPQARKPVRHRGHTFFPRVYQLRKHGTQNSWPQGVTIAEQPGAWMHMAQRDCFVCGGVFAP
jgi:hypothetical protein